MKKIVFIQNSLSIGGAEKFTFNVQNFLVQNNFLVEVLFLGKKEDSLFYKTKIEKLGSIKLTCIPEPTYTTLILRILKKISYFKNFRQKKYIKKVNSIINKNEIISFNDINLYKRFQKLTYNKKIVIHELCNIVQYNGNPYDGIKIANANITYIEDTQKVMMQKISHVNKFYLPLLLENPKQNTINLNKNNQFNISVISRIHPNKFPSIFINFFKILYQTKLSKKVHLYFIGGYDNKTIAGKTAFFYLKRVVNVLCLDEHVTFLGEQANLNKCLKDYKININWGVSVNEFIGYSSIESINFGIPCVFWDVDYKTNKHLNLINRFQNPLNFVSHTKELLENKDLLEEELKKQQEFIRLNNVVESQADTILKTYQ